MKGIIVALLTILIFILCAVVGYNIAKDANGGIFIQPKSTLPVDASEQHNYVIVQVDQLDAAQPRLVSVWFVSLFFPKENAPTVTIAQLFSPISTGSRSRSLEKNFSLTPEGEPSPRFWRAVQGFKIQWESYFVIDALSMQHILEWVNGPGDYPGSLNNLGDTKAMMDKTCQSLAELKTRDAPPFDWTGLVPDHFRSNLHMEVGLLYWNRVVKSEPQANCQTIPAR